MTDQEFGDAPVEPLREEDPRSLDGYRLLGRLGQGGQGTVFLAEHELPGGERQRVAVKVLLPQLAADPLARRRIADELELAAMLPQFAIVPLLAAQVDGDHPYLVSAYVPGPSLAERVRRDGPLRGAASEQLMIGTLTALAAIHGAGVVHHDLKPENVLLGPAGPLIADFDIALREGALDPQADADGGVLGSAAFLAPERFDAGPALPASDVFAWAATMVHAATGRSPFHAADTAAVVDAVQHRPPRLDGVPHAMLPLLRDCLAKDPDRRPTAQQALDRLLAALRPDPVPAQQSTGSGVPAWGTPDSTPSTAPGAAVGMPSSTTAGLARPAKSLQQSRAPTAVIFFFVAVVAAVLLRAFANSGTSTPDPLPRETWYGLQDSDTSVPSTAESTSSWWDVAWTTNGVVGLDRFGNVQRWRPGSSTSYVRQDAGALDLPHHRVMGARLSGDGERLVLVARDLESDQSAPTHAVAVVDVADGSVHWPAAMTWTGPTDTESTWVAVSRDGSVFGVVEPEATGFTGRIRAWRLLGGARVLDATLGGAIPSSIDVSADGSIDVSADGRWLAVGLSQESSGYQSRIFDLATARSASVDLPTRCDGTTVVTSPGVVICARSDGLHRFTRSGHQVVLDSLVDSGPMALSPDGHRLAVIDTSNSELCIVPVTGGAAKRTPLDATTSVDALAWEPSGSRVVIAYADGYLKLVTTQP